MKEYVVQPGDSLSLIAQNILGSMQRWPEIARLNEISQVDLIYPGQKLLLPDQLASSTFSAAAEGSSKKRIVIVSIVIIVLILGILLYRNAL